MTPEEQRKQAELADLERKKTAIEELKANIENWTKEYEHGLKRAKESEPKWEKLSFNQKVDRVLGWSRTNSQYYAQDGLGASIKKEIAEAQQKVDAIWKDLQTKYDIQPKDTPALDQAIEARENHSPEQQVPSMAERKAAKLAAREPQGREQPPSQATQMPVPSQQASVHSSQTAQAQQPQQDFRQSFLRNQEGLKTVEDYGRQQQAQREQPTPQSQATQMPVPRQQQGQQTPYEQIYSREAAQHAEQLKQIEQGVQQLKTEMQTPQQPGHVREFNIRETVSEYEQIYADDAQRWNQEHPQQAPTHHDRPQDGHGSRYQEHYRQANPTNSDAPADHSH